jgi:hypothetical protein
VFRVHPRVFARKNPSTGGSGLFYLDLRRNEWKVISTHPCKLLREDESTPLIVFKDDGGADGAERVVLYDCEAMGVRHKFNLRPDERFGESALFVPTQHRLLIQRFVSNQPTVEVWAFDEGVRLEKRIPNIDLGKYPHAAANGRVAFSGGRGASGRFEVLDLSSGRVVYSHRPPDRRPANLPTQFTEPPLMSPSGRCVHGGNPQSLIEIDTGRTLWSVTEFGYCGPFRNLDGFCVSELWWKWLGLPYDERLETYAQRSLDDGSLICRTQRRYFAPPKHDFSRDGRFVISFHEGCLFRNPPLVNYPLLALCQSILALPLILLWAILRWRRKKKAIPSA